MRTRMRMRGLIGAGLLWAAGVSVSARAGDVWEGVWTNRFEDMKAEWVIELPDGAGELEGTLRAGQASWTVKARREGVWLEVTWTDAEGRITQARGVVGDGEWRGLTISGGGGRMVAYGRFAMRRSLR